MISNATIQKIRHLSLPNDCSMLELQYCRCWCGASSVRIAVTDKQTKHLKLMLAIQKVNFLVIVSLK